MREGDIGASFEQMLAPDRRTRGDGRGEDAVHRPRPRVVSVSVSVSDGLMGTVGASLPRGAGAWTPSRRLQRWLQHGDSRDARQVHKRPGEEWSTTQECECF